VKHGKEKSKKNMGAEIEALIHRAMTAREIKKRNRRRMRRRGLNWIRK